MSSSNRLRRGLGYVLIVVLIVAGAQVILSSELGSSPVYVVVSRSMVPTLKIGDLVIAQSVPFSDIKVGDVIIYEQPTGAGTCPNPYGLTIVHRVVEINSQGRLITQGDDRATNPSPDEPGQWPPLGADCVKGKVVLAVPYLGIVSMVIPPPLNYILVGLILLFVFLAEARPGKKRTPMEPVSSGAQSPAPSQP